jgi:hypothetical protein
MTIESLKKMAQDAIVTAKDVAEKAASTVGTATTSAVESVRSVAPETFDKAVKSVTETATEAVEALRETKLGQTIVEHAASLADTATDTGHRIVRAAQAASEAFTADEPAKEAIKTAEVPVPTAATKQPE